MVLGIFVADFILLIEDDDDEEREALDPLRVDREHLLHSNIRLLLDLFELAPDVSGGIYFD